MTFVIGEGSRKSQNKGKGLSKLMYTKGVSGWESHSNGEICIGWHRISTISVFSQGWS